MKIAVFTKNRSNPAYDAARLGADRAAALLGATTQHFVPEKGDDPEQQSALIDAALALRPDAIVLTPVHPTRVNAALARINASGIPLFGFVNPIPGARCVSSVGSDDYRLGLAIAERLYGHLEGRGSVLLVSGPVESVTSIARLRAFRDAASAHPAIRIAGTCVGDYLRERAREEVARWLSENGAPDACLAANDIMAIGVIDALHTAGREAAVAGVNAIPEAIAAIKRGDMLATADFNAMHMAYLATECAVRHLRGEPVPASIELPVQIVDRRNCELWDLPYAQRPLPTLQETLA
ncbi:MAG: sugar ABC transporter substrate-binding protein [Betaproteobacteria bacterium]|nr:sugar ABC transporter substrate-binding protein [Betaproteobacteria bacterium]